MRPMSILLLAAVAIAGAFGAVARALVVTATQHVVGDAFPLGTVLVNELGCFLFGVLYAVGEPRAWSPMTTAAVFTGFLGGFTTFSSFANDCVLLLQKDHFGAFCLDLVGQNVAGMLALYAGLRLGQGR